MGIEAALPTDLMLTTQLQRVINWARRSSVWPMPFATACCGIELMATASSRYDLARPQNFLMNDCARDDIQCLDFLPIFKAHPESLYLLRDTHYNDRGNRLAATVIFEKLQGLQLISEHKEEK